MLALAMLAMLAVLAGCGMDDPLPPSAQRVELTMTDYEFDLERTEVEAGRVIIDVANQSGTTPHEVTLVELPENLAGGLEAQLESEERRQVGTVSRIPPVAPGEEGVMAADLAPGGSYALLCLLTDRDGETHAEKGAHVELSVHGMGDGSAREGGD